MVMTSDLETIFKFNLIPTYGLDQGLINFFCVRLDNKYFRFIDHMFSVIATQLSCQTTEKSNANKQCPVSRHYCIPKSSFAGTEIQMSCNFNMS